MPVLLVKFPPRCNRRPLTELGIRDAILVVGIDPLPRRVLGSATITHNHLRVVLVARLALFAVQKQEVYDFFCKANMYT